MHRCKGFGTAPAAVALAAMQAACGLMGRVRDREVNQIWLRVSLFSSLVMPVMQYGCEVWSTAYLLNASKPLDNPLQSVQTQFLRQIGGQWLRRSTNTKLLMAEFGCRPVSWQWCKLVCRYWNRLVSQRHNPLLQSAFRAELDQAAQGVAGWGRDVLRMIQQVAPETATAATEAISSQQWDQLPQLQVDEFMLSWRRVWWTWPAAGCDPAVEPGPLAAYVAWMSADVEKPAPYVDLCKPIYTDLLMGLVRFRLGAHHFRVSTGRWDGTARADRLRCKCAHHAVEDEQHVLFECPYYDSIRLRYATLYEAGDGSVQQLTHAHQRRVACLIHAIDKNF